MDSQDSLVSTYALCEKKTAHADEQNLKDSKNVLIKNQTFKTEMNHQLSWPEGEAKLFLQAMHEVGSMGGSADLEPITMEMIESIQNFVLKSSINLNHLEGIKPADLAEKISDTNKREQLLQILILLPYVDMKVDPRMVAIVDDFAEHLEIHPQTIKDLHRVRDNHLKRLLIDFGRRSLGEFPGLDSAPKVIKGVITMFHQAVGDRAVAERYQQLESYPEGSLGHTVFHWYRDRNWALPGEKKSTSELLLNHDCCHILGGFNTDVQGEMNVAAFQAGLFDDGFGFESLLEVILDFHLGKAFSTVGDIIPPSTGAFHPNDAMAGYEKGLACNTNLIRDLDFWSEAEQSVSNLRQKFNIPATPGPVLIRP